VGTEDRKQKIENRRGRGRSGESDFVLRLGVTRVICGSAMAMNRWILLMAISVLALCGCAHQYVMKLTNGMQVTTPHKPKLQGATYVYKDAQGRENHIPQSRVLEIAPASMVAEENKFTVSKPEKTHWWQFWKW